MFDDESEGKLVTIVGLNAVSDSIFEQETVDSNIEATIVLENE